jgi:hypothetical protein
MYLQMLLEHVYLFTTTRGLMFIVLCSSLSDISAKVLKWIVTSDDNLYTCLDRAIKLLFTISISLHNLRIVSGFFLLNDDSFNAFGLVKKYFGIRFFLSVTKFEHCNT